MKKDFNTYKEGLDLEVLQQYCMEHGERRVMERGETLEDAGSPAQWVAFVERGFLCNLLEPLIQKDNLQKDCCLLTYSIMEAWALAV